MAIYPALILPTYMHLSGRYGDPLNPWADIITVAEAWCASTPDVRIHHNSKLEFLIAPFSFFVISTINGKTGVCFIVKAHLVLGVPTDVENRDGSRGYDTVRFNAGR